MPSIRPVWFSQQWFLNNQTLLRTLCSYSKDHFNSLNIKLNWDFRLRIRNIFGLIFFIKVAQRDANNTRKIILCSNCSIKRLFHQHSDCIKAKLLSAILISFYLHNMIFFLWVFPGGRGIFCYLVFIVLFMFSKYANNCRWKFQE